MPSLPPREFVRSVRDYCLAHELVSPGSMVVVGVSGGPDSMALLEVLHELSHFFRIRLHVVHLDHGLRSGAAADAAFVADRAAKLGWPCTITREDVARMAARRKCSLEEAGRLARYDLLRRVAGHVRAGVVAVGHHRDDQAETVLMRLLRGSSGAGLAGIAPRRKLVGSPTGTGRTGTSVWLVRPLLGRSRAEIESFLKVRGVRARQDPTNRNRYFTRNRIRYELIPWLERRYNPALRTALARAAQAFQEDDAVLETLAERVLRRTLVRSRSGVCSRSGGRSRVHGHGCFSLNVRRLNAAALAVRRRVLRLAVGRAGAVLNRLTQSHLDALVRLAASAQGETHIPAVRAVRSGASLFLERSRTKS